MGYTRNYGIDLLRLVLMFMICILHVLGQGGVLSSCVIGTVQYKVYWFIEILAYCAVDGFAFISGYTSTNKPQNFTKIVNMWFQVWFYSFFVSVLVTFIGVDGNWSRENIICRLFPVTYNQFWYFTSYFVLFFAMPMLNSFLFKVNESDCKKIFILLFATFSIMGTLADPFQLQGGYSAIWLMVIYCTGVLAKRIQLFERKNTVTLVILWLCLNMISWAQLVFRGDDLLVNYLSPTIFMSGMILVLIFSRLSPSGHVIRHLSPLAFGIYLLQLNPVIWSNVLDDAFVSIVKMPLIAGVIHVLVYACIIFIAGLIVEFIRTRLAQLVKIDRLSKRVVNVFDQIITKLSILLQ